MTVQELVFRPRKRLEPGPAWTLVFYSWRRLTSRAWSATPHCCFAAYSDVPAPNFAIIALLTGVLGDDPRDILCSAARDVSPLSRIVPMLFADEGVPFGALAESGLPPASGARTP